MGTLTTEIVCESVKSCQYDSQVQDWNRDNFRCEMSEFRQNIELDLRTSMENSWVSSAGCSHYLGLVGDCDSGAVHIHSTFGVSPRNWPGTLFYQPARRFLGANSSRPPNTYYLTDLSILYLQSNRKDATVPFYPVPLVLDLVDVVDGIASISAKAVKENVL